MNAKTAMTVLLVTASVATFRRAGLGFTSEGTAFHIDDISDEQRKAIDKEPRLSVKELSEDAIPEGVDRTPFDTYVSATTQKTEKEKASSTSQTASTKAKA